MSERVITLMMDINVSKDKYINGGVDHENLIYVRWNIIKNHAKIPKRWSVAEKELRYWEE